MRELLVRPFDSQSPLPLPETREKERWLCFRCGLRASRDTAGSVALEIQQPSDLPDDAPINYFNLVATSSQILASVNVEFRDAADGSSVAFDSAFSPVGATLSSQPNGAGGDIITLSFVIDDTSGDEDQPQLFNQTVIASLATFTDIDALCIEQAQASATVSARLCSSNPAPGQCAH